MEHTPEPWATEYREDYEGMFSQDIFDANGETIATCAWYKVKVDARTTTTNREDNARRIVACVNFCKGLSTENMENDTLESSLKEVLERVKNQRDEVISHRDELLSALKSVKECKYEPDKIICIVDHVIAKYKE